MLHDNIKQYRKAKCMSQEELAVRLHVVRQTVSKWENGLSVPDADILMDMAAVLEVPVHALLGVESENLSEELAAVNAQLTEHIRREKQNAQVARIRGKILLLSFLAMILSMACNNQLLSILLTGACMLAALLLLYRNLALLTVVTTDDLRLGTLRVTTLFNVALLLVTMIFAGLTAAGIITVSEQGEELFALCLICAFMVFTGIMAPRLPFTRHTGLRLPWTVTDEDTWNVAHRILGWISLPTALLYAACALTLADFGMVTLAAMALWIGIPGGLSYIFYHQKYFGRK